MLSDCSSLHFPVQSWAFLIVGLVILSSSNSSPIALRTAGIGYLVRRDRGARALRNHYSETDRFEVVFSPS